MSMQPDYQLYVNDSLEQANWDAFVAGTPGGHYVQTSSWGGIKTALGWQAARVIATKGERIIAGAQLLIRSVPLVGNAGYVAEGPLIAGRDPELAKVILDNIMHLARRHRCQLLAIQPPNNGDYLTRALESLHFHTSTLELAPTASLVIDLRQNPQLIMAQLKHETRRNIGRSERAGIVVKEGGAGDLATFYHLYRASARRQGFLPYRRDYFDALWQALAPQGWVSLLVACYEKEPVAAQLLITFGDSVVAKMVGWSGKHAKRYPNDALLWASIMWAYIHDYRYFDFGGLDLQAARTRPGGKAAAASSNDMFKYGFGGKVVLYPSPYDYLPNRVLDWLYRRLPCILSKEGMSGRIIERLRKRSPD
jgi:lipid II:glycine glycyltransferase (peptidoglycan interpeptide bridge formation enzyme)